MAKDAKPPQLSFGPLPIASISTSIGLYLDAGLVVMSGNAQLHAKRHHPDDYGVYLPHIASVINAPLYVGDDVKNPGKIELVSRLPNLKTGLLVAVDTAQDRNGYYNVASFYPLSETKIANRRDKGRLIRPK